MATKYTTTNKAGKTKTFSTRDAAVAFKSTGGTSSSSSKTTTPAPAPAPAPAKTNTSTSSKTSTPASAPVATSTPSKEQQLATMKTTLEKASAELRSGTVTGLTPSAPTAPASTYNGNSIVDYLGSQGQANDFASRAKLAEGAGITGYTGTAGQNTQLLNTLKLNTKAPVPSTALTNGQTPQDVLDRRAQLEGLQTQLKSKQQELADLLKASETDPTVDETGLDTTNPLTNPDQYLSRYFTTDSTKMMTPAQIEQKRLLDESAKTTEDFYKNRDKNINKAYDKYDVTGKQDALASVQKEMADREVKLRNDIQALETAPEFRGVSREFAVDQRESIKSKGAFDLANLAIVESAYNGDLTQSRELAKDLIDNQFKTYEGKIEGYKARLAALIPQLDGEEKKQALALETAFDAQKRALDEKKADTELKYEYMTLAAKAGAPASVYKSILKATSADEAFMLAAPYMSKDSTSSNDGGASNVGGITEVVGGLSSYNTALANLDLTSSKTKINDIKNAVRAQFESTFSTKLISSLTDEQLRDFLIQYDALMREAGMNLPPEQVLQEYLKYIGKADKADSGGDELDSRIDNLDV